MKDQIEKLLKEAEELKTRLSDLEVKNGQEDGKVKKDAIEKDEILKRIEAIQASVDKANKPAKKYVFAKDVQEGEEAISFNKYLLMAKYGHPAVADHYLKGVMEVDSSAQGGYCVPAGYESMILGELNNTATIIQKCTRYPQAEGTVNIPAWATDLTVSWVDEKGEKPRTKPTLTRRQSILKKLACIVTATDEFLADEITNMPSRLAALVAENMGVEIERVALVGNTGAGDAFDGVLYAGANNTNQAGANIVYSDIVAMLNNATMLETYHNGAEFYMNRRALALIMNLVDGNGRPLWNIQSINGAMVNTLLGVPINLSSAIPNNIGTGTTSTALIYGNYKNIYLGEKRGAGNIEVVISRDAVTSATGTIEVNYWVQDMTGYRFMLRKGILVANPTGFNTLSNVR